jgi:glycerol-3-phosphate acyltransferase PlsY
MLLFAAKELDVALILLMLSVAYLCGSLSSAILVCQMFQLPDPRLHGSGNPGATNVLRLGGKLPAVLVLIADILKGTIPVYTSYFLGLPPIALGMIAVAACLGHIYPLYFGFKGGKAVATAFGAMLPLGVGLAMLLVGTWLCLAYWTRYSSLAAVVTVSLAPLFTWWLKPTYTLPTLMLTGLILWRHWPNIKRLLAGDEPQIRLGTKKAQ